MKRPKSPRASEAFTPADGLPPLELFVCGWDRVCLWRLPAESAAPPETIWRWRAQGRDDLPPAFQSEFDTTDECKPFDHGQKLLITSSSGYAALLNRANDQVLWYAAVPNAHSADLLPDNRVAVAASHSDKAPGDRLIVYDLARKMTELFSVPLPWGHGVVWDEDRRRLWVLDNTRILCHRIVDGHTPGAQLELQAEYPLPGRGGHDLSPVPGTQYLDVTATDNLWRFDRHTGIFVPHPVLPDRAHVKCLAHHPSRPLLAYVQSTESVWWSDQVCLVDVQAVAAGKSLAEATRRIHVPGEHFYKVRWNDGAR